MRKQLEKIYNPSETEDRLYQNWLENGYFKADIDKNKKPYTIVMPPPNITGQLHMGHALDNTLQDTIIRYKRMQGYSALWLPGTDHASIATEAKIVEQMKKEGLSKEDLGREKFLERAWKWKEQYGGRIISQLKKLGSSCDFSRERFTLDEGCSNAVNEVFTRLYEKGLIYRGERMINWCPVCKTSISDAEVEYEEKDGCFWHIRYPFSDGSGYLNLATTRPETLLGDTAVAVNPDDERYKDIVGKTLILPLVEREIPVVADSYVETDFGTGVVKITPAHDPNDFEVGLRHNLPIINVFTDEAIMNENGGKYEGMDRDEARKAVVRDLEAEGFLIKADPYKHNVGVCYRCHSAVEPRVSKQWFVKMKELADPAIKAVRNGETKFVPERFDKIYFHWMENIKDWCISRQLWWGHRIPAYYCSCGELIVSKDEVKACPKCGSNDITRDPDTLDTWFSSALWPFSTLGWPEKTADLDYFYPTDTLVTGYDIIFFWVARMVYSAIEQTGTVPFNTVLIHGLVRDAQGRKMSKSLGNGIDPLEIIEKYGADALRLTLATGNSPGNDMRFSDEKVIASRNFANKLWNAARFILMNLDENDEFEGLPEALQTEDKWILTLLQKLIKEVTYNLDKFELGIAVGKLYDFIWDILCDWYIELAKPRLNAGGETAKNVKNVLIFVFDKTLKLLHPFMPFITEEIWQAIGTSEADSIMISKWPEVQKELIFEKDEADFNKIVSAIGSLRVMRAERNVPPSKKVPLFIKTEEKEIFKNAEVFFQRLAGASEIEFISEDLDSAISVITPEAKMFIKQDDIIDKEKEKARLQKEIDYWTREVNMLSGKLSNENFVAKAPAAVVEGEKEKLKKAQSMLQSSKESFEKI